MIVVDGYEVNYLTIAGFFFSSSDSVSFPCLVFFLTSAFDCLTHLLAAL